ncbi:DUF4132 domain-containing protein [Candidatus Uabimicrobium amorphum]|uniref:DNA-binding protein n=1 Tax=Uabimicrobium amorphum TaxID=2596890 RepID=A0A5S9IPL5_UABAM|nr:DUF4132 domain-containing protein [Candidatus Uabimicrobium amorphum]BBM85371.1 DNA-binding protein [Candidatus Uabimicrobium amorphum]
MSNEKWISTSLGYDIALVDNNILCRNAKGKIVKTLPKKVKELPETEQLKELQQWLTQRKIQIAQQIETWFQRSLPISTKILCILWQDKLWQNTLENLVVCPVEDDHIELSACGFLKNICAEKGVGIINVDGETEWLGASYIVIPHPILIPDLADLRELATELDLEQKVLQLFREIWEKNSNDKSESKEILNYDNGHFEQLFYAITRAKNLGYKVSGGYATCLIWERGEKTEARYWIGAEYPEYETYTGELIWVNEKGKSLTLQEIGPIAFSEGHRMASAIFAQRKKDEEKYPVDLPPPVAESSNPPQKIAALSTAKLLEAGGVADHAYKTKKYKCDMVEARYYVHPVLEEETIVITTKKLGAGEDALMNYYGFSLTKTLGKLGKQINRAMGFPEWALVNDSKNAKYALTILKDFKKCEKLIKSKPGHAKTAFDDLAKELAKTAPHFLPSFHEEAGRRFIDNSNQKYAAQFFAKARSAEKVYALKIDENARRETFLEFALCGAVTTASLKDYAKELQKLYSAKEAYNHFQELCSKRICGGVPPFVGMGKLLASFTKQIKNAQALEKEFLHSIIEAPILNNAPLDFWKYYQKNIVQLCKTDKHLHAKLLFLFPMKHSKSENYAFWLNLLRDVGALEALKDKKYCKNHDIKTIAWLEQTINYCNRVDYYSQDNVCNELFAIIRDYHSAFSKESLSLQSSFKRWQYDTRITVDVDLLDLLLEMQIDIAPSTKTILMSFDRWLSPKIPGPDKSRELEYVATNTVFRPMLMRALGNLIYCDDENERIGLEKQIYKRAHLKEMLEEYLLNTIESLQQGYVFEYVHNTELLACSLTPNTQKLYPKVKKALQKRSPIANITRNLQKGILAEYGLKSLDSYLQSLDEKARDEVKISGIFPYLVVFHGGKIAVLDSSKTIAEYDITIAKGFSYQKAFFVHDDLLVILRKTWSEHMCYWMSKPQKKFTYNGSYYQTIYGLNELCRTQEPSLYPYLIKPRSDESLSALDGRQILFDGKKYWACTWNMQKRQEEFCEWDLETNKEGRASLPKFFDEFLQDEDTLLHRQCQLHSLPKQISKSILGQKGKLYGLRVKKNNDITFVENICRQTFQTSRHIEPDAVICMPQQKETLALCVNDSRSDAFVVDEDGYTLSSYSYFTLPALWWHLYDVRDETASKFLRKISKSKVEEIYKACKNLYELDADEDKQQKIHREQCKAIAEKLPKIKNERIIDSITQLLNSIVHREAQLESLAKRNESVAGVIIERRTIAPILYQLNARRHYGYSSENNLYPSLQQVSDFVQSNKDQVSTNTILGWNKFLSGIETLGMMALSPILEDQQRESLWLFLENIAAFFPKKAQLKTYVTKYEKKYEGSNFVLQREKNAVFIMNFVSQGYYYQDKETQVTISEISTAKKPTLVAYHSLQEEIYTQQSYVGSKKIHDLLEKLRDQQCFTITPQILEIFAQETGVSRGGAFYILNVSIGNQYLHESDYAKTVRDQLGLKAKEMKIAEKEIPKLSLTQINHLYEGVLETYWKSSSMEKMTLLLAKNWNKVVGKREPVSLALLEKAKKKFATGDYYSQKIDYTNFLLIANGSISEHSYANDGKWNIADDGELTNSCEDTPCFDEETLKTFCKMTLWLQTKLAVGDALAPGLAKLYAQTKERMSNKSFVMCLERQWLEESPKDEGKTLQLLTTMLGKPKKKKCKHGESFIWNKKSYDIVLYLRGKYYFTFYFLIRPALFVEEDVWSKMTAIAPRSKRALSNHFCISLLKDKAFAAVIKRMESSPLRHGEFEANPEKSAPKIVAKVQKKYKISSEAATLYLQTLTLAEPTKANILEWNHWKTAQYKKATTELVDKKLLLHAKRKRAGREHFLPGAWLDLKAPHLPLELWKLPLYEACLDEENRLVTPLGTIVATKCVHQLFNDAWQRVVDGDIPQWEKM